MADNRDQVDYQKGTQDELQASENRRSGRERQQVSSLCDEPQGTKQPAAEASATARLLVSDSRQDESRDEPERGCGEAQNDATALPAHAQGQLWDQKSG